MNILYSNISGYIYIWFSFCILDIWTKKYQDTETGWCQLRRTKTSSVISLGWLPAMFGKLKTLKRACLFLRKHCFDLWYIMIYQYTIWLFNSLPWKITMLLIGKPSISICHLYHGLVITRGYIWCVIPVLFCSQLDHHPAGRWQAAQSQLEVPIGPTSRLFFWGFPEMKNRTWRFWRSWYCHVLPINGDINGGWTRFINIWTIEYFSWTAIDWQTSYV